MQSVDGHYQLNELLKKEPEQRRWLKKAFEEGLPVAINAYGIFAQPAAVLDSGHMEPTGEIRMIKRGWLYVDPDALLGLVTRQEVEVGMFRSGPDSDLDTWATWKAEEKIQLRCDDLWIHEGSLPLYENDESHGDTDLHKRKEGNLLRIIGALLSELRKCSEHSQAEIIRELEDMYPLLPGVNKSNLENYFASANRAMENY